MKPETKVGFWITGVAGVAGIIIGVVKYAYPLAAESLITAVTYSVIIAIGGYVLRLWLRVDTIDKSMATINHEASNIKENLEELSIDANNKKMISTYDSILKSTAEKVLFLVGKSVRAGEDSFFIDTRDMALALTNEFWASLVKHQESINGNGKIVVRVTHSTSIDLWQGLDAATPLFFQREFTRIGGEITRIIEGPVKRDIIDSGLINNDEKSKDADLANKYIRVIKKMKAANIQVKYVENSQKMDGYDFTLVSILNNRTEAKIAMLWYAPPGSTHINGCEITTNTSKLENSWEYLEDVYNDQTSTT